MLVRKSDYLQDLMIPNSTANFGYEETDIAFINRKKSEDDDDDFMDEDDDFTDDDDYDDDDWEDDEWEDEADFDNDKDDFN